MESLLITNDKRNIVGHIYTPVTRKWFLRWCRSTTYNFVGIILQLSDEEFIIQRYRQPKSITKGGFHDIPCWFTNEGDYVQYVKEEDAPKEVLAVLSRREFMKLTKQTEQTFRCNESIKYTGC